MEAMQERISSYRAGTKVNVTIQRLENGQFVEKTFEVKLKKKTQVIKEDTTTSNNSESKGTTTPDDSQNDQQTDPFSEFYGEDGSLQIPGFGN